MKAIRLHQINDLRFEDLPMPELRPNEVLLRTASVSICGSDIHYLREGGTGGSLLNKPLILGHEFSAFVELGKYQNHLGNLLHNNYRSY